MATSFTDRVVGAIKLDPKVYEEVEADPNAMGQAIGVVALADLWNYFLGARQAKPLPPGTRIADTCSCYQKPVSSE